MEKFFSISTQHVNPLGINLDYSDDDNPLALKVDFPFSFCGMVVGSEDGLQPVEKTAIGRCVRNVYRASTLSPIRISAPATGRSIYIPTQDYRERSACYESENHKAAEGKGEKQ